MNVPEIFNYLGPDNPRIVALIDSMRSVDASLTPTLHVFAQRYGMTYFTSAPRDPSEDVSAWSDQQRRRTAAGYHVMAGYVGKMHERGIRLNLGTDVADPGRAALSEMLLLHDAGIPMADVFRIATYNTAVSIGREAEIGSVTVGRRANLVLFDGNPLERSTDLLSAKIVIKDGAVVTAK